MSMHICTDGRYVALAAMIWTGLFGMAWGARRPNFLFVIVDDQSPQDLRPYNPDSAIETPVLDRLAAQGITIDAAHHMGSWSGAVCSPSRHMIMSGRTVWHIPGAERFRASQLRSDLPGPDPWVPEGLAESTLGAVFRRAGYDTMRTCKKGNTYPAANAEFAVRFESDKRGDTDETGSGWHAAHVLQYLEERQARGAADPFFIYLGFSHPHDPRNGKPELLHKYGATNHSDRTTVPAPTEDAPPLPINYLPAHPFDHGHPNLRDEVAVSGVWDRRDSNTVRNELGRQAACSECIDTHLGHVLQKLQDLQELDNTYVFYTSDHGIAVGRHGLMGKQNLYEHTWRVPLIVTGPGIRPGSRAPGNVYLLDVLGTVCELAGIAPPSTNEGQSFRGVLEGRQASVRDVLYGVYCGGTKPGLRCVKQGDWKLIEYDVLDGRVRESQLFNLRENPHELLAEHHAPDIARLTGHHPSAVQRNLAGEEQYATQLAALRGLLRQEQERLHDPFLLSARE